MRRNRMLLLLAALCTWFVAATSALACDGSSSTKVSGTFDKSGHFVLAHAWAPDGTPIENVKGLVLASFTTAENLVVPAANLTGKMVCLFGDLDVAHKTMQVAGYQECSGACSAKGASASAAGAGCCSAKGASAAAASANAGGCCAAKGAAAAQASAPAAPAGGCPAMASAANAANAGGCCAAKGASANAGAGMCPGMAAASGAGHCPMMSGAAAKTASAGAPTCCTGGAKASAASSPTCHGDAAAAKTANATTESATVNAVVYRVTGMHCENCASKVRGAVAALSLPNVTGCTVDVAKGQAVVTTKGDVDRTAIQKAITDAGFPAELAKEDAATKS